MGTWRFYHSCKEEGLPGVSVNFDWWHRARTGFLEEKWTWARTPEAKIKEATMNNKSFLPSISRNGGGVWKWRKRAATLGWTIALVAPGVAEEMPGWISPAALACSAGTQRVYVAGATSPGVWVVDLNSKEVRGRISVPGAASGLAISPDGGMLVVTIAAPESRILGVNLEDERPMWSVVSGHTAMNPVFSEDGKTIFVCLRHENAISVMDAEGGDESVRIPVTREPVAATLTRDGRFLLVANHLPAGRSDARFVACVVSVIDVSQTAVVRKISLPNGSNQLRSIAISPRGRYAAITHLLARFFLPTTQLDRGWVVGNALTLVDLESFEVWKTIPLDQSDRGMANPWGADWSNDGRFLVVAHAGSHQLSVIDFPEYLRKEERRRREPLSMPRKISFPSDAEVAADLSVLNGVRRVVDLKGRGPRSVKAIRNLVLVGDYFSECLEWIDLEDPVLHPNMIRLRRERPMTPRRAGEFFFQDATLCYQHWQSCASCHSEDARVDGLNWDLLNDGIGNPKNTKSLVYAHQTPPSMSLGVRSNAQEAVRAGIRHILFTSQPDSVPAAMDVWLRSLKPEPSPFLVHGQPSDAAQRGEIIFRNPTTRCLHCHPPPCFTDLHRHAVTDTRSPGNPPIDTPALLELWRTAPYLHNGSAATLHEVLREKNPADHHGHTSHLTPNELANLEAYLLSL